MKTFISLILTLVASVYSNAFADNANNTSSSCNAEITVRLKEPVKHIKTNQPVIVSIQIRNISTNATLIYWLSIGNITQDFTWRITSPSGKDLSPKTDVLHEPISGAYCKIQPMELRDDSFDLSLFCNFSEVGTYKVVVKKQVVSFLSAANRTKGEVVSNPLNIVITK